MTILEELDVILRRVRGGTFRRIALSFRRKVMCGDELTVRQRAWISSRFARSIGRQEPAEAPLSEKQRAILAGAGLSGLFSLADAIGVSPPTIVSIFAGHRGLPDRTRARIGARLGIPEDRLDAFFGPRVRRRVRRRDLSGEERAAC